MKHRHSGKYTARKPKGGTCTKRKPLHKKTSKKIPKGRISDADKNLTWKQVHKKYPGLHPFGDFDGDGKKNYEDCRPLDKTRQDVWADDKERSLDSISRLRKEIEKLKEDKEFIDSDIDLFESSLGSDREFKKKQYDWLRRYGHRSMNEALNNQDMDIGEYQSMMDELEEIRETGSIWSEPLKKRYDEKYNIDKLINQKKIAIREEKELINL